MQRWAVYGFEFLAPAACNLAKAELVPGWLRFLLQESRGAWLHMERWSAVSQRHAEVPLEQWPEELLKRYPGGAFRVDSLTPCALHGHPARQYVVMERPRVFGRARRVNGLVWKFPGNDALIAVAAMENSGLLPDEVARTIHCA